MDFDEALMTANQYVVKVKGERLMRLSRFLGDSLLQIWTWGDGTLLKL